MSGPRVLRPIIGAGSRALFEQLACHSRSRVGPSPPSKILSCLQGARNSSPRWQPCVERQLRFSSTQSKGSDSTPGDQQHHQTVETKPDSIPAEQSQPPADDFTSANIDPKLPSQEESRRSALSQRFSLFMDRAQSSLFVASQRINDLTGYSGIETLKSHVANLEAQLSSAQNRLHEARGTYKSKVASRSATQREVTALLARQKTWTPTDFERFTSLYRQDYELEAEVAESAAELEEAEREAERLSQAVSTGILARYHEEQIWSDKIRRMSTWGTWGLMGVNVLLFLVFQFGAEPWRRARLVKGFEEKVHAALEQERERERDPAVSPMASPVLLSPVPPEQGAATLVAVAEEPIRDAPVSLGPGPMDPEQTWPEGVFSLAYWRAVITDRLSERTVALSMRDLSLIALQAGMAGATVAGTLALVFIRWL